MRNLLTRRTAMLAGAFLFVAVVVGATAPQAAQTIFRTAPVPAVQVINFREGVGLFDTSDGALYELRGNLDNPSSKLSWFQRVEGIEGTSGIVTVQQPAFPLPNAIFLVDVQTGNTWILRDRGNDNGSWEPVSR